MWIDCLWAMFASVCAFCFISSFITVKNPNNFSSFQTLSSISKEIAKKCVSVHFYSAALFFHNRHQQRHWKATQTGCRWFSSSLYNINTPCLCIRWFAFMQFISVSMVEKKNGKFNTKQKIQKKNCRMQCELNGGLLSFPSVDRLILYQCVLKLDE